ncbi:hypothetical protein D3C87_78450 [compost metagenome]
MGTQRKDYVILGANIGYDNFNEDMFENFQKQDDFIYLMDGMNGEYLIVGKVLATGDEFEGFVEIYEYDLDSKEIKKLSESVKIMIKENFDLDKEPKIIVLTQWR